MLLFVAFALVLAPSPMSPPPSPAEKKYSLHIPDEISPAVDTYTRCRLESVGAKMFNKDGSPQTPVTTKGGDCSAIRTKAIVDADVLLAQKGKKDAARAKIIDKAMKSIDEFADNMGRVLAAAAAKK